jgi:hypothetical protein
LAGQTEAPKEEAIMRQEHQAQGITRASQPPARRGAIAAANTCLPLAFSCLVCLSLLVSILISLPR